MSDRATATFDLGETVDSPLRCTACTSRACESLGRMPGVAKVDCDAKGAAVSVEFDPALISERDLAAEVERFGLEMASSVRHVAWRVIGLDCPDCARAVAKTVSRIKGVSSADLNYASGTLLVEYDPAANPHASIAEAIEASGYALQSLEEIVTGETPAERPWLDRKRVEIATVGSGVFAALGILFGWFGAPEIARIVLFAIAIIFGGLLVWRRAFMSLKAGVLDMNVLMSVAVFGAAALGEWGEGATVFFLFSLGGLLEARSLERTRRSIRDLMDLTPELARVVRGGAHVMIPLAEIAVGNRVVVRPGERVPVDGTILTGSSAINEAAITGESVPVDKGEGDNVFAGTLNTSGLIEVEATSIATDSTLARIVYLVEEAQASKAPAQAFIDKFSRYYTPSVIGLAVAIAVVPVLFSIATTGDPGAWQEWVRRALVMLVVSCPCALVISTPVAIVSAITRASRDGVLVKGGTFLETAARVDAIAFDKTGTLTMGVPELADTAVFGGTSKEELLAVSAALESHSNHPLARAIVRAAGHEGIAELKEYREVPGEGVTGTLDGTEWSLLSPARARQTATLSDEVEQVLFEFESRSYTTLVLLRADEVVGLVALADEIRPETYPAVVALRSLGIDHLAMLTGDNERVADAVTAQAGLTTYFARLLPAAKTDALGVLQKRYGVVAMVGDGINDAPALAAADIGIAMGAAGTDTALQTADVALMRDDLLALPGFIQLGRRTVRTIATNIGFSILVKAVFLILALTGTASLWMAVFADTGVSLLVILNGMRLLRASEQPTVATTAVE